MRPSAMPSPSPANSASTSVSDLEATAARCRADRGGGRRRPPRTPRSTMPAGEAAPAAMEHRHAAGPCERHRQAVGDQDQRRQARPPASRARRPRAGSSGGRRYGTPAAARLVAQRPRRRGPGSPIRTFARLDLTRRAPDAGGSRRRSRGSSSVTSRGSGSRTAPPLTPPLRVENAAARARELGLQPAARRLALATPSRQATQRARGGERDPQLVVAARRPRRRAWRPAPPRGPRPTAGPSGTPAAIRSAPSISRRTCAPVARRSRRARSRAGEARRREFHGAAPASERGALRRPSRARGGKAHGARLQLGVRDRDASTRLGRIDRARPSPVRSDRRTERLEPGRRRRRRSPASPQRASSSNAAGAARPRRQSGAARPRPARARRSRGRRDVSSSSVSRLHLEPQAGGVAGRAQRPGGVVGERLGVQHAAARPARRSSSPPCGSISVGLAGERHRHRVDREVAPGEVAVEAAPARPRAGRPGARSAPPECAARSTRDAVELDGGGREPLVLARVRRPCVARASTASPSTATSRSGCSSAEQQVADGAADQIRTLARERPRAARATPGRRGERSASTRGVDVLAAASMGSREAAPYHDSASMGRLLEIWRCLERTPPRDHGRCRRARRGWPRRARLRAPEAPARCLELGRRLRRPRSDEQPKRSRRTGPSTGPPTASTTRGRATSPTDVVQPPFAGSDWSYQAGKLLEFSPIIVEDGLYFLDIDANFYALDTKTGQGALEDEASAS